MARNTLGSPSATPMLVRGIAGIVFGLAALFLPLVALASLVALFAAYLLVDGALAIVASVRAARTHERWVWLALEGVVTLAAAAATFILPGLTVVAVIVLLGVWAFVSGVLLVIAAVSARDGRGRGWIALAGAVSIAWGALLLVWPGAGAIALVIWIGAYALVFGIALVVTSIRMRQEQRTDRQFAS